MGRARRGRPGRASATGWPKVDVIDRRHDDPGRAGLFSERLVTALRSGGRVVCVLNRKGRSRLLACTSCGEVAHCERCDAAVVLSEDDDELDCRAVRSHAGPRSAWRAAARPSRTCGPA